MRIAIVGAGGRYKTERAIAGAAEQLGHAARLVDVATPWARLGGASRVLVQAAVSSFHPDLVLFSSRAARFGPELAERIGRYVRTVYWHFDLQFSPAALAFARGCQMVFVTYLHQVAELEARGLPAVGFLPQGTDPTLDRPPASIPQQFRCEVSFVGSGQFPLRYGLLRAVAAMASLQIPRARLDSAPAALPVVGGRVDGARFGQAVGGAAISLGLAAHAEQRSTQASASNRMWRVLGCGGFYLGEYVPGIEHFARQGEHCAWSHGEDDLVAQVGRYLARPQERARVATAGRAHALAHHTYAHRLPLLLEGRGYTIS